MGVCRGSRVWGVGRGLGGAQGCAGVRPAPCASTRATHILPQVWSRQYPHQHSLTPSNEPLASLTSNFCRNPEESQAADGVRSRAPWCAAIDPGTGPHLSPNPTRTAPPGASPPTLACAKRSVPCVTLRPRCSSRWPRRMSTRPYPTGCVVSIAMVRTGIAMVGTGIAMVGTGIAMVGIGIAMVGIGIAMVSLARARAVTRLYSRAP